MFAGEKIIISKLFSNQNEVVGIRSKEIKPLVLKWFIIFSADAFIKSVTLES